MKMTKILSDRSDRSDDLVAAGETINMVFQRGRRALSLRAGKAFHLLVKHCAEGLTEDRAHKIALKELREIANLTDEQLVSVIRELQQTTVEITHICDGWFDEDDCWIPGPTEIVASGPLLTDVERPKHGSGMVRFRFSNTLRDVFGRSDHWAILSKRAVLAFESRYALRLFELISLRINLTHKNSELMELDELRRVIGVPENKLISWNNLNQAALKPAIAEVNHLAGFKVDYEPIKHGRSVTGIKLSWKVKDPDGVKAAKRELDGHSTGRKARRDGMVETVVGESPTIPASELSRFPSGSIGFSEWKKVALQELPAPQRDTDLVAGEFRAWAASKSLPLDSANIEKVFRSFCRKVEPVR
jgi:hypothetical protein